MLLQSTPVYANQISNSTKT